MRVVPEDHEKYKEALKRAAANPDDEAIKPFIALDTLAKEIEKNGFAKMIDLDPYFGETSLPFKEQTDLLEQKYPEDFSFFKEFMDELQEEIELHFELTEMYEDEEFDQFVEDMGVIKRRYSDMFEDSYRKKMRDLFVRLLDDIAQDL